MELLAPSGTFETAKMALNNGADAVYIGGKFFSARMNAVNFSDEEVTEIISIAHLIGKKVYVTMNTMLYQDEFDNAVKYAEFLHRNNVDGLIIQDIGLAHYLHQVYPNLPLHASTQINCHNLKQAVALKEVGFSRIVLAREADLSLARAIKQMGLEVEVFIHGALCVSYSGNCLMSSIIGSRSGNRGRCAQPCRMKYALVNKNEELISDTYALSTKDLMTIEQVNKYIDANVDSLKIEGRLKQDEYVFSVVNAYRHAIDIALAKKINTEMQKDVYLMKKVFSRTFTKGYVFGESPLNIINQSSSSHQGERIGEVIRLNRNAVSIKLSKDINRLDGIRFNDEHQYGLTIGKMFINGKPVEDAYKNQIVEIKGLNRLPRVGCEVIRSTDYKAMKSIQEAMRNIEKKPVTGKFIAFANKPMTLEVRSGEYKVSVTGAIPQEALTQPMSKERIKQQLEKSGSFPFVLSNIDMKAGDNIFVPVAALNELRNNAFEKLSSLILEKKDIVINEYHSKSCKKQDDAIEYVSICNNNFQAKVMNQFNILAYSKEDPENLLLERVEFEPSVINKNAVVSYILKNEDKYIIGSPYLNIANSYALDAYYELGFNQIIPSLELDYHSLKAMINDYENRNGIKPNLGLYVYGYLDMMVMRSCPIGTMYHQSSLHCQRCHKDSLYLKDRMNVKFPIYGDKNCNIHILNCVPLYLLDKSQEIINLGIHTLFLRFTIENENEIKTILNGIGKDYPSISNYSRIHYSGRAL